MDFALLSYVTAYIFTLDYGLRFLEGYEIFIGLNIFAFIGLENSLSLFSS